MDTTLPFYQAKYDGLAACSTAPFPFNPSRTEVRFIDFHLSRNRGVALALFGYSFTKFSKITIDCIPVETGHVGYLTSVQINYKTPYELAKLSL